LGLLQLPEYFKNSGEFLIPRGPVLLQMFGKEIDNLNNLTQGIPPFPLQPLLSATFVVEHICEPMQRDVKFISCSDDATTVHNLLSQPVKGRMFISEYFLTSNNSYHPGYLHWQ
jgi:hypothetical protein